MSYTITIPGGSAELFEKHELTPRRQKPVKSLIYRADELMNKMANVRTVVSPSGEVDENPDLPEGVLVLSAEEADMLLDIEYASAWATLKSWTIDLPLPRSVDEFMDVPSPIADAIAAGAKRIKGAVTDDFEPTEASLENPDSPTGASVDSVTPTEATAPEA